MVEDDELDVLQRSFDDALFQAKQLICEMDISIARIAATAVPQRLVRCHTPRGQLRILLECVTEWCCCIWSARF